MHFEAWKAIQIASHGATQIRQTRRASDELQTGPVADGLLHHDTN
jgi:hypothetical protein